jgi:hypothetical protein
MSSLPSTSGPSLDVSFVVPLFDKAAYVERALGSALAQTLPAREIVVVDDGSRDDGPTIVERLASAHPTIRLIRQANAGPSAARNRAIAEARGTWVAFLDADDMVLPRYLERAAELAAAHPSAGVLAAAYVEVTEGHHDAVARGLADTPGGPGAIVDDIFRRWCQGPFFYTSSTIVRRAVLAALDPAFPPGENLGEDHDVWFRLAERTPVAWTPAVGALYSVGDAASLTGANTVLDPLPAYRRLAARVTTPAFPASQRRDAARLVATHLLNVARARADAGDRRGALALLAEPASRSRLLYWARTAARLATPRRAPQPVVAAS